MQIDSCADPHPAAGRVFGVSRAGGCFYRCQRPPIPIPTPHPYLTMLAMVLRAIAHAQSEPASSALYFCTRDSCVIRSGSPIWAAGGIYDWGLIIQKGSFDLSYDVMFSKTPRRNLKTPATRNAQHPAARGARRQIRLQSPRQTCYY